MSHYSHTKMRDDWFTKRKKPVAQDEPDEIVIHDYSSEPKAKLVITDSPPKKKQKKLARRKL